MLQTRLPKSSVNSSKRLNRRARISLEAIKNIFRKFLPLIILIPLVIFINSLFIIHKVNCTFNNTTCPQEVQSVLNNLLGTNSLFVNQKELLTLTKTVYPTDKINVGFKAFNTLNISLGGSSPYVQADVYLVNTLPILSMDMSPSSTDSAGWWVKPTGELESYILVNQAIGFNLWENGSMTSVATTGANISYIFSEKPTSETVTSIFKIIKMVNKYLEVSKIYIVNQRVFLSRPSQPDIIVGVPFDEGSLSQALQSVSYLATIKKDAKVIDLSFKNPIIR
jgi:hypothetical protein